MPTPVTHCANGHEFTLANTYLAKREVRNGVTIYKRVCRECHRSRQLGYRAIARKEVTVKRVEEAARFAANIPDADFAWAAGLFEGEGTVTLTTMGKGRGTNRLVVSVSNTDRQVTDFFQERWPGSKLREHFPVSSRRARRVWVWNLTSRRAEVFLRQIRPFIRTERVSAKIALALEAQEARVIGTRGKRGATYHAMQDEFMRRMRVLNRRGRPDDCGGETVADRIVPDLENVMQSGELPPLLPEPGRPGIAARVATIREDSET